MRPSPISVLAMPTALAIATSLTALAGCGDAVDPEPLGDYTAWKRIDAYGEVPGHGDSYRIIYINDVALSYAGGGYPEGSIIVKEVRQRAGDQPGDLRYIAIMRRLGPSPIGLEREAGWLFTQAKTPGGSETYRSLCWNRCHVAAPFAGAFLDYGK
jgi:Cytochrome P460